LAIEASMLQAAACRTVYRCTCDETCTLRVSSVNWKHFYLGVIIVNHSALWLFAYFCALEIVLLTYLHGRKLLILHMIWQSSHQK